MSTTLKAFHDRLLQEQPDDASHIASDCPFCTPKVETENANLNGGTVAEAKTYTQEEQDALLAQVSDLKAKVAELTKASEDSEIEAKIAAAKAEVETQVADLQSKLDSAVLEAEAAKTERDETVSFLESVKADADAAAQVEARKEERITKVKEVASFPDEYLEANADRFAAMSDEAFETALEDWAVIAPKKKDEVIPPKTAMTAERTTSNNTPNVLSEILDLRFQGVDVRNVR